MKCSSALELHYYGHASTLVLVFGLAQIILFLVLIILHKSRRMRNFFHIRVRGFVLEATGSMLRLCYDRMHHASK